MQVTFWGVRGSLPTPPTSADLRLLQHALLREVRQRGLPKPGEEERFLDNLSTPASSLVGGNTPCVQVEAAGSTLIFDAGSGIRQLGRHILAESKEDIPRNLKLFLSHTHWDHIQGLPYFAPLYVPGCHLDVYSGFPDMSDRLAFQHRAEFFPVPLASLPATLKFHTISAKQPLSLFPSNPARSLNVQVHELNHPGGAYGFRLEADRAVVVYAADSEYSGMSRDDLDRYCHFFRQADLLIFDSQFSFHDALERRDWGHASAILGVNIAQQAKVKRLALFHHSTEYPDQMLHDLCAEATAYKHLYYPKADLEVILARESLTIDLSKR